MSNPLRALKQDLLVTEDTFPSSFFEPGETYQDRSKTGRDIPVIQKALEPLDMEIARTFIIEKALTIDPQVHQKVKPALASAKTGKQSLRVRSAEAFGLGNQIWKELPATGSFGARDKVRAKVQDTFYVDGGTEHTLGRLLKAYPRKGSKIISPPTAAEARAAVLACGLSLNHLPDHALRPFPLIADQQQVVTINPKSENGFPVLGQWKDPGAPERVLGLTRRLLRDLDVAARTADGVQRWYEDMMDRRPDLVACRGKAKADYYGAAKVEAGVMRFYNVVPRQIALIMQTATQALESVARNILDDPSLHTAQGVSLAHGGAERLVEALEQQLKGGFAYVHGGDDSWVVCRAPGRKVVQFALDCSNFDLTQHAETTEQIHDALWTQLRRIEVRAADLWRCFARERLVVVAGTVVRKWRHAGPSGMPLQSKVNDVLMEVLLHRLEEEHARNATQFLSEEAVDALLQRLGTELGLVVRVEQHKVLTARSVREALQQAPFLFLGYYFHLRGSRVLPFCDLPRTLSQMPYPGLKWVKSNSEHMVMESMRLGSTYLSAGIPPYELEPAFRAWKDGVLALLDQAQRLYGDVMEERLKWAVGQAVYGPELPASLAGLRKAIERGVDAIWVEEERELPSTSVLIPGNWADEMDEEDKENVAQKAAVPIVPPDARLMAEKPMYLPPRGIPTHPATPANDGRHPPTAVWGPPKPKRTEEYTFRGRGRRGRLLPEEGEEEWFDDEISDDFLADAPSDADDAWSEYERSDDGYD